MVEGDTVGRMDGNIVGMADENIIGTADADANGIDDMNVAGTLDMNGVSAFFKFIVGVNASDQLQVAGGVVGNDSAHNCNHVYNNSVT